jgi:cytochrome c biogenesis protein CcmG, thiol:disulfide interchange protein DsbE
MSKRRVAALAAVIIVPVVALAIVLASVLDDGSSNDSSPPSAEPNRPVEPDRPEPSKPAPTAPGTGGAKAPDNPLSLLDSGTAPKQLSETLAPASEDGTITLGELRGTPIVLNVWSADCLPCRGETRALQSEWERLGRRGVLFLGLNVLDAPAVARRYREENDVTYPSVEEKRAETARELGARGVPETLFISKSGNIVGRVIGGVSLAQIEVGVRAATTGQSIPTDQGGGQIPLG